MRIPRIYQAGEFQAGQVIELSQDGFQHCIKVLRLSLADKLIIFDGSGHRYEASISQLSKKSCSVQLETESIGSPPLLQLSLIQSIIKPDKMDMILQKAVELGVTSIFPCISNYSDIKHNTLHFEKKIEHWQKIIIQAARQSGVDYLPILHPIQSLSHILDVQSFNFGVVLDPNAKKSFHDLPSQITSLAIAIGPEGGFTENEIKEVEKHGFVAVNLGKRILRAETAAIVSLSLCQWKYGDF